MKLVAIFLSMCLVSCGSYTIETPTEEGDPAEDGEETVITVGSSKKGGSGASTSKSKTGAKSADAAPKGSKESKKVVIRGSTDSSSKSKKQVEVGAEFTVEKEDATKQSVSTVSVKSEASAPAPAPAPSKSTITFTGYVGGVFAVTVDGTGYADMEDFYTKELAALPAKVAAAGYAGDYEIQFDADIGYGDLWENMNIYIAPQNLRGYQGQSRIGRDGKFSITLPGDATDDLYQVKATKKIKVKIDGEGISETLCYNFSAVEQSVAIDDIEKPIILNEFVTSMTAYNCQ